MKLFDVNIDTESIGYSTDYWVFTIGSFKKITSRNRIDVGLNLYRYSKNNLYRYSDKNDPDYIFDTFIQYEFSLN